MGTLIRPIEAVVSRSARAFGGKAANLAALARAGFPVPSAFAVSGRAALELYEQVLDEQDRPAALARTTQLPDEARLARLRRRIEEAVLPPSLDADLRQAFRKLRDRGARALAVRSSSTLEDQVDTSAAGLHETILQIEDETALLDAVRRCWASPFHLRVLSYLRNTGSDASGAVGIVIQAMVPAEVAGVLFTVNPLTGDRDEMVINAAFGLGTSVTDGRVSPDTYRVDKETGWIRDRVIGTKTLKTVAEAGRGVHDEPLPAEQREREALDEHTLKQLVDLGRRIEAHFGEARDIEWAAGAGELYVLQARPVTTIGAKPRRMRSGRRRAFEADPAAAVWSNVNVGEALPGVATPLTWSVLSSFSDLGFRRAFGALGCTVPRDALLVGNFRGRVYLNLTALTSIASQVPGLRPHTVFSLGGGEREQLDRLEETLPQRGSAGFLLRLPWSATGFARSNLGFEKRLARFERHFQSELERIHHLDLRILTGFALDHTLWDVRHLLDRTGSVMLTAYANLLGGVVMLRTALRMIGGDAALKLEGPLLSGLEDVESARPGRALWRVAQQARREPEVVRCLWDHAPERLSVAELPPGPTRAAIERFLHEYGHRGAREAELAEPRWRENPTLLFATLRGYLARSAQEPDPAQREADRLATRARADARLDEMTSLATRAAVRRLLRTVRRYMRLREHLRSNVIHVLGLYRLVALEASRRIAVHEPEQGDNAAFFLTLEELHAFLRGRLKSVGNLVRRRRVQYDRDAALPDPPDTFVGYPPSTQPHVEVVDQLEGLGASPGVAEGVVRVISGASGLSAVRAGDMLVAPYADVGWSPIFLLVGALVTDVGGPLSHAAVVAREYGVPTVVNVRKATRALRTGDRIRVDGDTGLVHVLQRADPILSAPERAGEREHA